MAVRCQACGTATGRRFTVTDGNGTRRLVCTRCAYAAAPERTRDLVVEVVTLLNGEVQEEDGQGVLFGLEEEVTRG